MARTYVTTNIEQPDEDWRKVKWWYRIVSFIFSLAATFQTITSGELKDGDELYVCVTFPLALFIGYKTGVKGGCIGNRIRLAIHPKSIRMNNPTTDDLIQMKIHWLFHHAFLGIAIGSICGSILTVSLIEYFFK